MKKRSLSCMILALILSFGCFAGCDDKPADQPPEGDDSGSGNYTVTFDVGEEARKAGCKTPEKQTVMGGTTAVEPSLEYESDSTWWQDHELVNWLNGTTEWNFRTDKVKADMQLTANWRSTGGGNIAEEYEKNLTWGQPGHLYVHYLKGSDDANEHGTVNPSVSTHYDQPIDSEVYGDWGLWVWEYNPVNNDGRAFYPAKLDESGAVYDIDLNAEYHDAGWDSTDRVNAGQTITYANATWLGLQVFSQDSRLHGQGFWVNDGGDNYVELSQLRRDKGDYHWFIRQGEVQNGTPKYESFVIFDPYEGLEPGSAVTKYDVVSNKGGNNVYVQQKLAEGWDEDAVGYEIFMASFADSDGDGMGDLQGVISKLGYLEELGVDVLWLTPFQQSNSYHGYDIRDYFTVDRRFGTLDDYRQLLTEAHARGMKVLMDFVLNHTSTSNPWFEKSQKLVKETVKMPDGSYKTIDYRNFYTWQNEDYTPKNDDEAKQWFKDANGYQFFSSFNSSMPELNFDYQATRDAILDVALYWMSFGLDGFRLDAVKHIYMENENPNHSSHINKDISSSGDYSFDVNKNNHFFLEFNAKLKSSYPSAILVGENFNGDPIKIAQLYPGLDSQFNFNWYYDTTGCIGAVAQAKKTSGGDLEEENIVAFQFAAKTISQYNAAQFDFRLYRKDYIDSIFTSNHDVQRARDRVLVTRNFAIDDWDGNGAQTEEDVVLSEHLAKIYAGMCFTVPGITWIYGGDEIGMFGTKTPNAEGEGEGHEDRWLRQPMKWSKEKDGDPSNCEYEIGFHGYVMTWDKNNQTLDGVKEQKEDPNSIYNVYKALIKLRKEHEALRKGTIENLTTTYRTSTDGRRPTGESVTIYSITYKNAVYRVYVNPTGETQSASKSIEGTLLYTTNPAFTATAGGQIAPYTFAIYKIN